MNNTSVIRIIILIIGIAMFLIFLLPMFVTFNPNIGALTGMGVGALLIVYGIWGGQINSFLVRAWRSAGGKILEIILLVICAVIISLAAATSVAMISASSKKAEPGSTAIVLGCRVYQDHPSRAMIQRLEAAYDYLQENPESACIVSGGQGKNEPCTESSVMYAYLVNKGIDPERIYIEDKSTDTMENIAYSMEIIEKNFLNPKTAIVTDGYHEYRALRYAEKAGLDAGAVPASTIWWLFPTGVVREMYGILEQWFINRK